MKRIAVLIALFIISSSLLMAYEVRRGERPPVDWSKVPAEAYQAGKLRIKLQASLEELIPDQLIEAERNEHVHTGVASLDELNSQFMITSYKPVFAELYRIPGRTAQYRDRHRAWGFHLWFELEIDERADVIEAVRLFASLPEVEIAEPVLRKRMLSLDQGDGYGSAVENITRWTPNDPRFTDQWHYHNTGQSNGTIGADIDLVAAWEIEKGLSSVIVAIIDGGIQVDHPDLAGNMWPGLGYNFTEADGVIDPNNHGTHVAGTIAAVNNNGIGVAGVAGGSGTSDGVRLMSCQVFSAYDGNLDNGFDQAPIYAADNGAAISQNSWGYTGSDYYEQAVLDGIDYFNLNGGGSVLNGGISIFAAGNDNSQGQWYPGCYNGVLSVAATNNTDTKSSYSNYAPWVEISAPGGDAVVGVLSTKKDSTYGYSMGTSMACPHVSGVAALVLSYAYGNSEILENTDLADILINSTDDIYSVNPGLEGMLGSGRLNAHSALLETEAYLGGIRNPSAISATAISSSQINLAWTKNADNNNVMLVFSTNSTFGVPVNGTVYSVGANIPGGGVVLSRNASTSFNHTGLSMLTTYHYKFFSYNSSNQYSPGRIKEATTLIEGKYWTGNNGTNWHNATNWSDNAVPNPTQNVIITGGLSNYPIISSDVGVCNYLMMHPSSLLTINGQTLFVYANAEIEGQLILSQANSNLAVAVNLIWKSDSTIQTNHDQNWIGCKGNIIFEPGSNVQMLQGTVEFFDTQNSYILNRSTNTQINHLKSNKAAPSYLYISSGSTADFTINGNIMNAANATMRYSYDGTVTLKGNLINENTSASGGFLWNYGTLLLNGDNQTIILGNSSSYLNNLSLDHNGPLSFDRDLKLKGDLLLYRDSSLSLGDKDCIVDGDASITGILRLDNPAGEMRVYGNFSWNIGAIAQITHPDANIYVQGNMNFRNGSNINISQGNLEFFGDGESILTNNSGVTTLKNLRSNKSATGSLTISASSTAMLTIRGNILNSPTSTFYNNYNSTIYFSGNINNQNTGSGGIRWDAGTLACDGPNQTFTLANSADYLNNLNLYSNSKVYLQSNLVLKKNLSLISGTLYAGDKTITVGGDWASLNPANFVAANSTVIFNGTGTQTLSTASFNILRLNKAGGGADNKLVIASGRVVTAASYKFEAGTIEVTGGSFTVADLADNTVKGNYIISSGLISFTQDSQYFVDLDANLVISGGKISIQGGYNYPADWGHSRSASITMSDGELDFNGRSIGLTNSGHAVNVLITGGTIRTAGSFVNGRTGLNFPAGTIELYGTSDATLSCPGGGTLYDVKINKTATRSGEGQTRANKVTIDQNVSITRDLTVWSGTLALNAVTVNVGRDLYVYNVFQMNNTGAVLNIGRDFVLGPNSNVEITRGTINITRNLSQAANTPLVSAAQNTINFVGTGDSSLTLLNPTASLGSIGLSKSSGSVGISTTAAALNLLGNMTVSVGNQFMFRTIPTVIAGALNVSGTILLQSGGSVTCYDLNMYGNVTVAGDLSVQHDYYQAAGTQLIIGSSGNFVIDKPYTGNYQSFAGTTILNGGAITITNEGIQFGASSALTINSGTLRIGWGLRAMVPDSFHMNTGAVEFIGSRYSDIQLAEGNYLNNVIVSKAVSGTLLMSSNLLLRDLTINSGTFQLFHHTLNIAGNLNIMNGTLDAAYSDDLINLNGWWNNNRSPLGFTQGSGTVAFVGLQRSVIYQSEQFNNLIINKTGIYPDVVEVESGATLSANNINYIDGTIYLKGGSTLNTPASGLLIPNGCALRCDPNTPSTLNLYGDFADFNSTVDDNQGFSSGKSVINAIGSGDRQFSTFASPLILNAFNVNLNSGICYLSSSHIKFFDNLSLQSGTLRPNMGATLECYQNLSTLPGTNLDIEYGSLNLMGSAEASFGIQGSSNLSSLTINKDPGTASVSMTSDWIAPNWCYINVQTGVLRLNGNTLSANGSVHVNAGGTLLVDAGSELRLGNGYALDVYEGGRLSVLGTAADPALVSRISAGAYGLTVNSGGSIAADHAIFEYMDYSGVNIFGGATVDPVNSFNNSTFRCGASGGTLLNINSSQFLTVSNAVFPANTWSGMSNVSKNMNTGSVRFINESGAFAGSGFENDPWARINWNSQAPSIAVNQSVLSFGDVYIPMSEYRSFTISNSGSGTLAGTLSLPDDFVASTYRAGDGDAKVDEPQRTGSMDFMVLPGSWINVQIVFSPTQPIAYNSTCVITHNAGGSPVSISLTGYGMGAQVAVNPPVIVKGILPGGYHNDTLAITDSGNQALSYYASVEYPTRNREVIFSESFESSTFPPTDWSTAIVAQSGAAGVWGRSTGTVHPVGGGVPDGQALAYFNSYTCSIGNQTRLQTGFLNFSAYSSISLSFWMYHNSRYPSSHDSIQIQINQIQDTWVNVGAPIDRVSATNGWQQHTISLSAYGNQNYLRLGFLGTSAYGDDIHIDNIVITGSNPPTNWVYFNGQFSSVSGTLAPGSSDTHALSIYTYGMETGTYQAEIHIASNDPITPNKVVPIEISVGSAGISVSPTAISFGNQIINTDAMQDFSITATGDLHLIGNISVPAGYSVQPDSRAGAVAGLRSSSAGRWSSSIDYVLAPGETESYQVKFTPTALQAYNGNLNITSDHLATQTISLSGTGANIPSVQTLAATAITGSSATLNAQIVSTGGLVIYGRGFRYGTDPDPIANGNDYFVASTNNSYSAFPTGFASGEQIYFCAFAYNEMGWGYGEVLSFSTFNPQITVTPSSLSSFGPVIVNSSSAAQSFTVSGSDLMGSVALNASPGFRISLDSSRLLARLTTDQISLSPDNGVLAATVIYVFFEPTELQAYSGSVDITTPSVADVSVALSGTGITTPSVTAIVATQITQTTATSGGNITDEGGNAITARGVCWSEGSEPTLADEHSSDGSGSGVFTSYLSDLLPGTQYFVRAYAVNLAGTVYSEVVSFFTASAPLVSASQTEMVFGSIIVGQVSAPQSFIVAGDGLSANLLVTAPTGFQIAVDERSRQRDYSSQISIAPSSGSVFETILLRFAPPSGGEYSGDLVVSSLGADNANVLVSGTGITTAVLSTKPVTDISSISAQSGGLISSDGFSGISVCGICWSLNPAPTTADFSTLKMPPAWDYNLVMNNLQSNTTYHVRAFAINAAGTAYGNELSFSTSQLALNPPSNLVITKNAAGIQLSWDAVLGALSYKVYRSLSPDAADWGAPVANPTNPTWTDTSASAQYFYRVTASSDVAREASR